MIKICPNPIPWSNVFKKLSKFADDNENLSEPPVPLILNGWVFSNDFQKKERWEQTVSWAKNAGCQELTDFLTTEDFYFVKELSLDSGY